MIRIISFFSILFLILNMACSSVETEDDQFYDLVIINARIVDGSGQPPFTGYVAINNGEIARVGKGSPEGQIEGETLNAENRILSPGFIDLHAHGNPLETPEFNNFLAMGVTSITLGQDGGSPGINEIAGLKNTFESSGLGPNLLMFYGHGTLRDESGIGRDRQFTASQQQTMDSLMRVAMTHTFGLSLGLEYSPGLYSDIDELSHLAEITGEYDRLIMSHMRNEDDDSLRVSINEMLELGNYCRIHISHLKSVYGKGVERAEEILSWLHEANDAGIQVTADEYPYTASYTGIAILFPDWAKSQDQFEVVKSTRRKELEEFLYDKVMSRNGPAATLIGTGEYAGMTLEEAAGQEDMSFVNLLIDKIGPQGASGAYFVMDEALQARLLQDSLVAVCSDGSPTGYHPRGHGTFARIIEEYVVKRNVLQLPEAIYKMTGFPARILGLEDRGLIREGMKADLILFNEKFVHENAEFSNPLQQAEGFEFVMVNGKWARYANQYTDSLSGKYIVPQNIR